MSEVENLSQRRCSIYPDRPAVARCPECRRFFSRECIVEHEGRLLCAACIDEIAKAGQKAGGGFRMPLVPALQLAAGTALVWMIYLAIARLLILIPSDFHEGTIWNK